VFQKTISKNGGDICVNKANTKNDSNLRKIFLQFFQFLPYGGDYLREEAKRESASAESTYICPECGKPFENINATERHLNGTYEIHLTAWHARVPNENRERLLVAPII
jgi:hypothetical protein